MMLLLCLRSTSTAALYLMSVLSTCSTKECGLQLTEKMRSRSVVFRNVDIKLCHSACIGDSFMFASCHIHPENHPRVLTESCGSKVCNNRSQCVDEGCEKACMEAPPLCDLHTVSKTGDLLRVKFLLSQGQANVNCQEWIGRTPVMWAASGGHREVVELLVSEGGNVTLVDRFGINLLHSACLGGDAEVVKYVLLQNMLDINGRVSCGRTAVMLAAEKGHKDVVQLLVEMKTDLSLVDKTGDNILHCACRGGDIEVVNYILSRPIVDINSLGHHKKTAVMVAAEQGHQEVVELLIKHRADLSFGDKSGNNVLHNACYMGLFDVVQYILTLKSVDINSRGYLERTPVMVAAQQGHKEVVELLVKHGADLSFGDKSGNNVLHNACYMGLFDVVQYILTLKSVDINSRGYLERTPVMVAAQQGHKEVVELLVKHGADLSLRERSGSNVLHNACFAGRFDVVKYILSLNSVDINSRGYIGKTPVMVAAEQGYKEVVELLVKHGADLSLRERSESNVLHNACFAGRFDVVKYILSLNSVDINSRGYIGKTPVMAAAEQGHKEVVELLVKHGADLSLRERSESNVLHNACFTGRFDVVKYILSLNSVDINSRGYLERTPVMAAAEQGHKEVVELLVKHGADLSLRDEGGQNMLDLARQEKRLGVVQYVMSL